MTKPTKENIISEFESLGDSATAQHSQRFFKTGKGEYGEGDIFLGIRVPVIRKLVKKHQDISLNTTTQLLKSEYHEIRLFAAFMLVSQYKKADTDSQTKIYNTYLKNLKYINNWDIVDGSAHYIVGIHLIDNDKDILYSLAINKNLWKRRVAIMSTFTFIKHEKYTDALAISEILLNDKEDLIHKAVGWMLREIGNRSLDTEEKFLRKHYLNMPRTMLRYAIEKLPETKRKAYLKGKI